MFFRAFLDSFPGERTNRQSTITVMQGKRLSLAIFRLSFNKNKPDENRKRRPKAPFMMRYKLQLLLVLGILVIPLFNELSIINIPRMKARPEVKHKFPGQRFQVHHRRKNPACLFPFRAKPPHILLFHQAVF